jgi:hypothetical protein
MCHRSAERVMKEAKTYYRKQMPRSVSVRGKEYKFHVRSKTTRIEGPKLGVLVVDNMEISHGPIEPGKIINFIVEKLNGSKETSGKKGNNDSPRP